jgi:hypothetical protein
MRVVRVGGPSTTAAAGGGFEGGGDLAASALAAPRNAPIALLLIFSALVALRWATSGSRECGAVVGAAHVPPRAQAPPPAHQQQPPQQPAAALPHAWDAAVASPRADIRDKFTRIYSSAEWGRDGGGSGTGSTLAHTATMRVVMEMLIYRHNVQRLLDAPCGSAHWWPPLLRRLRDFNPAFSYTGVDVVKSVVDANRERFKDEFPQASFFAADLSTAELPVGSFDLSLCRDALQHLPLEDAIDVIANIARARPRVAAFGSYVENNPGEETGGNVNIRVGEYYLINLRLPPFSMNGTMDVINENSPNAKERKYVLLYSGEYLSGLDFDAMRRRAREGKAAFDSKKRRLAVVRTAVSREDGTEIAEDD